MIISFISFLGFAFFIKFALEIVSSGDFLFLFLLLFSVSLMAVADFFSEFFLIGFDIFFIAILFSSSVPIDGCLLFKFDFLVTFPFTFLLIFVSESCVISIVPDGLKLFICWFKFVLESAWVVLVFFIVLSLILKN